jgi:Flp pilus assembly protein TadD
MLFLGFWLTTLSARILNATTQEQVVARQIAAAIRSERFSLAVELADRAVRDFPNDAKLWTLKGIACEKIEHIAESREAFETAAQLSPNYVPALKGAAREKTIKTEVSAHPSTSNDCWQ